MVAAKDQPTSANKQRRPAHFVADSEHEHTDEDEMDITLNLDENEHEGLKSPRHSGASDSESECESLLCSLVC
eukprot:m.112651 g.112651  ORF g.112651 m.112651 type:complete len:73 (-) comp14374_c0_seq5:1905-2123(-)